MFERKGSISIPLVGKILHSAHLLTLLAGTTLGILLEKPATVLAGQGNDKTQVSTFNPDGQCMFDDNFRFIAIARPDIIGRCLGNPYPDPDNSGNIIQQTTKGMLSTYGDMPYFLNGNATYLVMEKRIYERENQGICPGEMGAQVSTLCREVPLVVKHIYTQENAVALTADDGASRQAIKAMAEAIITTNNKATFFINGMHYQSFRDLIEELDQTGSIYFGNHTFGHADLKKLADAGAWSKVNQEIAMGDPRLYIPDLKHFSPSFRFPGFSDTPELRRLVVSEYGLTVYGADQGNLDYTVSPQSAVDRKISEAQAGQIAYFHFLQRNIATFKSVLERLNERGIRAMDVDSMLDQSLTRSIFQ
ncbi:polysaccharide deacetylase family protein [Candidatus Daviesbacteria bacterium]|nr:polysaccharide deacetylase family protein [Candidatus Daviesbacteria bacterium]